MIPRTEFCLAFLVFLFASHLTAQQLFPDSLSIQSTSQLCQGGEEDAEVTIQLPELTVSQKVDILFLMDDTNSYLSTIRRLANLFPQIADRLEVELRGVDLAFGVARFEDFGGPGYDFSREHKVGRPFILNQPILSVDDAGSREELDSLIVSALRRTAPGYGGDGPEASILGGLYQAATGAGYDGDGNGSMLDSGPAGDITTQTSPGNSGDVPPFASYRGQASGEMGGVGWREDAIHIALLATDICPVVAFPGNSGIPDSVSGIMNHREPVTAFASRGIQAGTDRFGFISDALSFSGNTIAGAVVPAGVASLQETITALNKLGIQVIGMGPEAYPTDLPGPSFDESVFLSALARLTGAVDQNGEPLIIDSEQDDRQFKASIVSAIVESLERPVDISVDIFPAPELLNLDVYPNVHNHIEPTQHADFELHLSGAGLSETVHFAIRFMDIRTGAVLGEIPARVACDAAPDLIAPECALVNVDPGPPMSAEFQLFDGQSGIASIHVATLTNARIEIPMGSGNFFQEGDTIVYPSPLHFPIHVLASKINNQQSATALIEVADAAGNSSHCDPVYTVLSPVVPLGNQLWQNYPNPFNPTTTIRFSVATAPGQQNVAIKIYDITGREVRTLLDDNLSPGEYTVNWDGTNNIGMAVSGGLYIYRMVAGEFSETRQMVLLK